WAVLGSSSGRKTSAALFGMPMVEPSFGDLATRSVPREPPAPRLLTGTIGTFSSRARLSARARAAVSVASPAASGMMKSIGRDGEGSDQTDETSDETRASAQANAARVSERITASSFVYF